VLGLVGVELAADQPLDGEDGVHRIGDRLPLRDLPDEPIVLLGEPDDRRSRAAPLAVAQDLRGRAFHDRDAAVRRAQVDSEDSAQKAFLPLSP